MKFPFSDILDFIVSDKKKKCKLKKKIGADCPKTKLGSHPQT